MHERTERATHGRATAASEVAVFEPGLPPVRESAQGVVRSFARAVERPCARPGCPSPAQATLTFAYASKQATIDRLSPMRDPQAYDLCLTHAARTDPPLGWALTDRRPDEDRAPPTPAARRDLGGSATVEVLAAALRAVPDVPDVPPLGHVPTVPIRRRNPAGRVTERRTAAGTAGGARSYCAERHASNRWSVIEGGTS